MNMSGATTIRVLVVDDDPEFVLLIRDLLEEASRATFVVEDIPSLSGGIKSLERNHYDVILLDYKLPDGDGFEFLSQMNALHLKIPVVIVTGHGDKAVQVKALEAGAVEYLSKGTFNTDLLERTCIYAIGLQEKRNSNGGGPGVGVLIEQLVELTRDAVKAQTEGTLEIRELRKELNTGITSIKEDIASNSRATQLTLKNQREISEKDQAATMKAIEEISHFRWLLGWIKANPLFSTILFLCVLLAIALAVVLLQIVDLEKIKVLKDATSSLMLGGGGRG